MSLFFAYKLTGLTSSPVASAWHQTERILAMSTVDGYVTAFSEEGERIEKFGVSRSAPATSLAFRPMHMSLACGFEDGVVCLFKGLASSYVDGSKKHDGKVMLVCWSPEGRRVISTDENGNVFIWKVDSKNNIEFLNSYTTSGEGPVVKCVFKTSPGVDLQNSIECPPFFLATDRGVVYLASDSGEMKEVFRLHHPISALLFMESRQAVVSFTRNAIMSVHRCEVNGGIVQAMKVKVSASDVVGKEGGISDAQWVGPALLAYVSNETMIRVWDLKHESNYLLSSGDTTTDIVAIGVGSPQHDVKKSTEERKSQEADRFTGLAFNARRRILAGMTHRGRIVFWRYVGSGRDAGSSEDWELFSKVDLAKAPKAIVWGPGDNLLSARFSDTMAILFESSRKRMLLGDIAAVQVSSEEVQIASVANPSIQPANVVCGIRVKGLVLTERHMIVWDRKQIEVYDVRVGDDSMIVRKARSSEANVRKISVSKDQMFFCKSEGVEVWNLRGGHVTTLALSDSEGEPIHLDAHNDRLAVATTAGIVRVWNIAGREPRRHGPPIFVFGDMSKQCEITSIRLNSRGTCVSVLARIEEEDGVFSTDRRLFIYDIAGLKLLFYDFSDSFRFPVSHFWDDEEERLLAVEVKKFKFEGRSSGSDEKRTSLEVCTLLVANDKVLLNDSIPCDRQTLLGCAVPHLFFIDAENPSASLTRKAMRDFEGIDIGDGETKRALVDFSFYLATGNVDAAYGSVRRITGKSVWRNMARMCVKMQRFDVASVCIRKLGDVKGAAALRSVEDEKCDEVKLAMVAIQLGMYDSAEELYKSCSRFDLLVELYRAQGKWDKALDIARKFDKMHVKTVAYQYAKYLESLGKVTSAIKFYEMADAHRYEVPRMLFRLGDIERLGQYVVNSRDKELFTYWAKYKESVEEIDEAVKYYMMASDHLSAVRVNCFSGRWEEAERIVDNTEDPAASFFLAKNIESEARTTAEDEGTQVSTEMLRDAMRFFLMSGQYDHALRLAMDIDSDHDIISIAMQSSPASMNQAALFFENRGMVDKAVVLYQKSGNVSRAIDICFEGKLFDVLAQIADLIGENAEPEVLGKCARFFLENGKYDRAVQLLLSAKEYEEALRIASVNNVMCDEQMAEKFTLTKTDDPADNDRRIRILTGVAELCEKQGLYHLATKKYTQAGDKTRAMKVLLQSGDTEKIIFFANVSKKREIFVMAANYLQSQDWRSDPRILKSIVTFYQKARAFENLANFFDSCSLVEIDDYRDYEKALGALKEALKYANRIRSVDKETKLSSLQTRIDIVGKFVTARSIVKTDPAETVKICMDLLDSRDSDSAVRIGDVFALLIEYYHSEEEDERAYDLIQQMENRRITLSLYLDDLMISEIYKSVGVDFSAQESKDISDVDEEIEEEIDELW